MRPAPPQEIHVNVTHDFGVATKAVVTECSMDDSNARHFRISQTSREHTDHIIKRTAEVTNADAPHANEKAQSTDTHHCRFGNTCVPLAKLVSILTHICPTVKVALHPSSRPNHTVPLAPPMRRRRRPRRLWTACASIGVPKRALVVRGDMAHAPAHRRLVSRLPQLRHSTALLFRCRPPRVCSARIVPAPEPSNSHTCALPTQLKRHKEPKSASLHTFEVCGPELSAAVFALCVGWSHVVRRLSSHWLT